MAIQKSTSTPTLISKGCIVEGRIESDVFVRIDGHIKGDVFIGEGLIVGENGLIEGNVHTREIVIFGTINGTVKADSIELKAPEKFLANCIPIVYSLKKEQLMLGVIMKKIHKKEIFAV